MSLRRTVLLAVVVALGASCGPQDTPESRGAALVSDLGCTTCHVGGGNGLGPSWEGVAGSDRLLEDGSTVVADADYLRESIVDPSGQIVEGWRPAMPVFSLEPEEIDDIVAYLVSLGSDASSSVPTIASQPSPESPK